MNTTIRIHPDPSAAPDGITLDTTQHGLLTGGSSAAKAALLKELAKSISSSGIPVFLADCRSNCSGLALTHPVTFWDLEAAKGLPLRTTVSELGPLFLSRILGLNDLQGELMEIFFQIADKNGLLLIDTKDLKALIGFIDEHASEYAKEYGNISKQSTSAILRKIVSLEGRGAQDFLFEPAIDVRDFLTKEESDAGRIHIFEAKSCVGESTLYTTFLLYLLSELNENLPDAAAGEAPQLVFVFDESALLFDDASRSFLNKIEQLLEGLTEKGVTVFFAADKASDIPESIHSLLTDRIEVPADADAADKEALSDGERTALIEADPLYEKYKIPFDRDSAYEFLLRRGVEETEAAAAADAAAAAESDTAESDTTAADAGGDTKEKKSLLESIDKEAMAKQAKSSAQSLGTTTAGTIGRKIGKTVGSAFGDFGETLGGNIGASLGRGIMNTLFKA